MARLSRAESLARTNKRECTVINAGVEAAKAGKGLDACPYKDTRNHIGRVTFSRAWRKLWIKGYRSVKP